MSSFTLPQRRGGGRKRFHAEGGCGGGRGVKMFYPVSGRRRNAICFGPTIFPILKAPPL